MDLGRMSQPAIKRRFVKCHAHTFLNLTENYKRVYVETESSPFHFMVVDELGVKYIRIELNGLSDKTRKVIEEYRKKCSSNTICEVRIFRKYGRIPERITI